MNSRLLCSALSLPALAFGCTLPLHAQSGPIPSIPLANFQDRLGVNLHMEYTDGKYADAHRVLADLQFLGLHRVRDNVPQPERWKPAGQGAAAMAELAAHGMQFDLLVPGDSSIPEDIVQINAMLAASPGCLRSVEGPNEINNWPIHAAGMSDEDAAEAFQRRVYAAVKTNPATSVLPVLYLTGGAPIDLGSHPGLADAANTHPYPHNGEQPYGWLGRDFASYFRNLAPAPDGAPRFLTETGYYTLPSSRDWGGVDEPTQAALLLNTYFDAALQGVSATYVYQLLDPYPDPQGKNNDDHFGFFRLDGTPKPSAWALHRLAAALPDDAPSPARSVSATIHGLPAGTGHALALTASDGSVAIFFWNEAPLWDEAAQHALQPTPVPVSVTLPGAWSVRTFDPMTDATSAVTAHNGSYDAHAGAWPTALIFRKR